MKSTNALKKKLTTKSKRPRFKDEDFLSTGSTLLNLACSGRPYGGLPKGKFVFIVGDSASGKTALTLTMLAEATIDPNFKDYRKIHDDNEGGNLFDIRKLFGRKLASEIENGLKDGPTEYIEEFYYRLHDLLVAKEKFIWVEDSMDSLQCKADEKKFEQMKKAFRSKTQVAGSYEAAKPKINSQRLGKVMTPLGRAKSILVIISQSRDNLGFGADTKTRAGGRALKFYACIEMWSSIRKTFKKKVRGKDRVIGILCKIQIKKNRITGKPRTIEVPIYYSSGFDDIGSCIDYLLEEKHWKKAGGKVVAAEFGFKGTREKLIRHIEAKDIRYPKLQRIVGEVWNEIEAACAVKRKSRYA